MSDSQSQEATAQPGARVRRADRECDGFEAAWKAGQRPRIEDHLAAVLEPERPALLRELILLEVDYRRLAGEQPRAEEFQGRFPTLDRAWIVNVLAGPAAPATRLALEGSGEAGASRRLGKFLLLQQLGQGGFGTVWRAHDTELDRVVAIKIPDAGLLASPVLRARFRREARAAARLSHPNVVTLFEVDQVGDTPLLVMEYVEGTDLDRLVKQSGPLPVRQACDCIWQAALGLQHAHERGLVHRDLKPANILLARIEDRGSKMEPARSSILVPKIADFGLARLPRDPEDADTSLTEPGCLMGTADFIAPEQARNPRNADSRADVYSLGCTLYYLLTGRVPFPGGTFIEKTLRHHTEEPPPVEQLQPAVSPALAAVVRKMMAHRPEDRQQTAAEVAADLTTVLQAVGEPASSNPREVASPSDTGMSARAVTETLPAPPPVPHRWRAAFLLAVPAALGLLLVLLRPWNWIGQPEKSATPAARKLDPSVTNSIGMKLALIRPGRFQMGSPLSEPGRFRFEGPRREVQITRAYYMGVHEVTQREFETVMGYNPSYFTRERGGGPDHPVERVSYFVAVAFCERLSRRVAEQQAGRVYRLPTEAEWEYACRAGSRSIFSFGDDSNELEYYAWYAKNAGGKTHPVEQRRPNAWGLYDMHGNVWEWCSDWFNEDYYRDGPTKDPNCTQPMRTRVLRGGGWGGKYGDRQWCRSAMRGRREPGIVESYHGLRVVFTVPAGGP